MYWDKIVHCGKSGYKKMAQTIYNTIEQNLCVNPSECRQENIFVYEKTQKLLCGNEDLIDKQYSDFIQEINTEMKKRENLRNSNKIGAIVMNCNPFTLGHLYLIEYASREVDLLYIFVVEENKSFFTFNERIDLVRKGTAHLSNVVVFRSGKLMISSVTFPEYFMKDNSENMNIDSSVDIDIFARIVAPALGISVRFVGEEPLDYVTRCYNERMKEILPVFGIEFVEIPRRNVSDEDRVPISASLVRKYLKSNKFDEIKKIVPDTTFCHLYDNYRSI